MYAIVRFFQMGGFFMFPILLVLAAGIAISIERWLHLKRVKAENSRVWNEVHPVLAEGDFDKAREMVNEDSSALSQMLAMGLARQGAVRRREDIEIAMEERMMEIIPNWRSGPRTWRSSPTSPPSLGSSAPSWALSRPSPRLPRQAPPKRPHCWRPAFRRP